MSLLDKFKRDITRHPARAGVLGVLSVVMVVLMVRAVLELQPRPVSAGMVTKTGEGEPASTEQSLSQSDETEAVDRIGESKKLWPILREVSGMNAAVAFTFDASYYMPDPTQRRPAPIAQEPVEQPKVVAAPAIDDADALKRSHTAAIREQARALVVQSIALGSAQNRSMAIVNQQLMTVGQGISGFEITAIRAREVEFTKDGVTIAVKMADDPRGH